jgi:hypothetical protein
MIGPLVGGQTYTYNFILPCQWIQWPRPFDSGDYSSTDDLPLVFTRDVNGDGVTDSVNLFLDAHLWDGAYYVEERPGKATFWVELQGYTFGGTYLTDDNDWKDVFPIVWPAGSSGYYSSRRVVMSVVTNYVYGDILWTPDYGYSDPYAVHIDGLTFFQVPSVTPGFHTVFCRVDPYGGDVSPLQPTVDDFNAGSYAYFYGSSGEYSNWPLRGDGTDTDSQVSTAGYPNTVAFAPYVDCSLASWPTSESHTLSFYGRLVSEFIGTKVSSGSTVFERYDTRWTLTQGSLGSDLNYGFRIVPSP